jgi:hypothetical protein
MHSLNTFGAKINHEQTHTHKTHHDSDLGEATTFPLIVYFVPLHEAHIQMAFCPRTPKFLKFPNSALPRLWGPITFSTDLRLIWGLKQSCSCHWELSNCMWHATYMQGNQVDSRLLLVGSQNANLTPGLPFDQYLCFKCPNGACKPISDIYVPRAFQWYKASLNPISFDPCNHSIKIWESNGTLTPKVRVPLGVWGFILSHSFALPGAWNVILGLPFWLALLQALALVMSPRLGLRHIIPFISYPINTLGSITYYFKLGGVMHNHTKT